MKHRNLFTVTVVAVFTLVLTVGSWVPNVPNPAISKEFISLLTCGTAGTYFPLGGGFARIWSTYVPEVNATAETSGCSVVNLRLLEQGQAHTGIAQNDAAFFATEGLKPFEKAYQNLRGIMMLYDEQMHIVTTKDTGIKTIADMKGKRVRTGTPGGMSIEDLRMVLEFYGMTFDDMKSILMSLSDSVEQLKDGDIDVSVEFTGAPSAGFMDVATHRDLVLVGVDMEHAQKINKKYPFLSPSIIPAGTYKGQDKDTLTMAVTSMLLVNKDISEDVVYKLTKTPFEHLDILQETHAKGKLVKLETALKGMPLELHPGAAKFYREKGMLK